MTTHTHQIGSQTYHCDESGFIQPVDSPDVVMTWKAVRDPDGATLTVRTPYYEEAVRLVEEVWGQVYFVVALA